MGGGAVKRYTPELSLRGVFAAAPASHIGERAALIRTLNSPGDSLTAFGALILRGAATGDPKLRIGATLLSAKGNAAVAKATTTCVKQLGRPDSVGGLTPSAVVRKDATRSFPA